MWALAQSAGGGVQTGGGVGGGGGLGKGVLGRVPVVSVSASACLWPVCLRVHT